MQLGFITYLFVLLWRKKNEPVSNNVPVLECSQTVSSRTHSAEARLQPFEPSGARPSIRTRRVRRPSFCRQCGCGALAWIRRPLKMSRFGRVSTPTSVSIWLHPNRSKESSQTPADAHQPPFQATAAVYRRPPGRGAGRNQPKPDHFEALSASQTERPATY